MKKILLISAVILAAVACHKEPYTDSDNEYLVYTTPGKDVNFTSYKTFDLADSLLIIGQSEKPEYSQSDNALALIQAVRTNMEKMGYIYTPSNPNADLGIQMTFVVKTERYVQYYNDPYWWLDYPGYWSPGFWGNYTGFYYRYPVSYTYSTNSLMIDMVDLTTPKTGNEALEVIWSAFLGGPAGFGPVSDLNKMKTSIDQAFAQSSYLKKTTSR
ncbi:MAG: DUF4136 domain-containing protein [Bacteroidales bacterium]|nr:DUF4136 domain-containing protein [Bacteroidales bacterium]